MVRPVLAAALLAAVLVGGFVYGALNRFADDTGSDW